MSLKDSLLVLSENKIKQMFLGIRIQNEGLQTAFKK